MTDTFHGVPYPAIWENMDALRRRAWQAGVLAAVGHLGIAEARKLAAELEATNGQQIPVEPGERAESAYEVYRVISRETRMHPGETHQLAKKIIAALVGIGWGDLSSARIDLTAMKVQYQETIKECNEALRKATGGR